MFSTIDYIIFLIINTIAFMETIKLQHVSYSTDMTEVGKIAIHSHLLLPELKEKLEVVLPCIKDDEIVVVGEDYDGVNYFTSQHMTDWYTIAGIEGV